MLAGPQQFMPGKQDPIPVCGDGNPSEEQDSASL